MRLALTLTPEERNTMAAALREYVDLRIPINEYVDRLYPDAGEAFKKSKIKSVGRKVRQVRALIVAVKTAQAI